MKILCDYMRGLLHVFLDAKKLFDLEQEVFLEWLWLLGNMHENLFVFVLAVKNCHARKELLYCLLYIVFLLRSYIVCFLLRILFDKWQPLLQVDLRLIFIFFKWFRGWNWLSFLCNMDLGFYKEILQDQCYFWFEFYLIGVLLLLLTDLQYSHLILLRWFLLTNLLLVISAISWLGLLSSLLHSLK